MALVLQSPVIKQDALTATKSTGEGRRKLLWQAGIWDSLLFSLSLYLQQLSIWDELAFLKFPLSFAPPREQQEHESWGRFPNLNMLTPHACVALSRSPIGDISMNSFHFPIPPPFPSKLSSESSALLRSQVPKVPKVPNQQCWVLWTSADAHHKIFSVVCSSQKKKKKSFRRCQKMWRLHRNILT